MTTYCLLVITLAVTGTVDAICVGPETWYESNARCYSIVNTPKLNHSNADIACVAIGAQLTSINDEVEDDFIGGLYDLGILTGDYWLGLYGLIANVGFSGTWKDGSASTYRNWNTGEPNEGNSCGRFRPNKFWYDMFCTNLYGFICEKGAVIDCSVSGWSEWSECSVSCGGGTKVKNRTITTSLQNGGAACPALIDSSTCKPDPCPVCVTPSPPTDCLQSCGYRLVFLQESCSPTEYNGSFVHYTCDNVNCHLEPESIMPETVLLTCETLGGLSKLDFCYYLVSAPFAGSFSTNDATGLCEAQGGMLAPIYDYSNVATLNSIAGYLNEKASKVNVWTAGLVSATSKQWITTGGTMDIKYHTGSILTSSTQMGCLAVRSPDTGLQTPPDIPIVESILSCGTESNINKALCLKRAYGEQFSVVKDQQYSGLDPQYMLMPAFIEQSAYICGAECLKVDGCLSFVHDRHNKLCTLYSVRNMPMELAVGKTIYYRRYDCILHK